MKTITAALRSLDLLLAGGNAIADDMMKKDTMASDAPGLYFCRECIRYP
jgi:pentapeptide MXKDX repeat protein